MNGVYNII